MTSEIGNSTWIDGTCGVSVTAWLSKISDASGQAVYTLVSMSSSSGQREDNHTPGITLAMCYRPRLSKHLWIQRLSNGGEHHAHAATDYYTLTSATSFSHMNACNLEQ